MPEKEPFREISSFQKTVEQEKREHIGNIWAVGHPFFNGDEFKKADIDDYFKDKPVNPDTIAAFLQNAGKSGDEIEGRFPKLRIRSHKADIIREIKGLSSGEIKFPSDLMAIIGEYVHGKMSYDLLQVLFTNSDGERSYNEIVGQALANKQARYAISQNEKENLPSFYMNLRVNGNFSPNELSFITELSIHSGDADWIREQMNANPPMGMFLQKLIKQYSAFLYGSEYGGIIPLNQNKTRDVYEVLNNIHVGVCRDFAMIIKQIYLELAPELFPDSEVIYVENHAEHHAYNLLMYEKDGKIHKEYYDPTSFILGWSFRVPKNKVYGNKKEVWANNKASETDQSVA